MARTKAIQFEDKENRLEEARAAMKATDAVRLYVRYQCIYLFLSGESRNRISSILDLNLETIGIYIRAYCTEGLEGLQMNHSPGRPKRLTSEQEQELCQIIVDKRPADVGFPANMNWTASMIRQWIEQQYQVNYSERGTRELLYRLGFSFTRPTYTLAKADPEQQEAFKQTFEGLKKLHLHEIARILFEDECMIRDYQALANTWFPKGQQKRIPTYGQHRGAKLMGTIDYETGEIYVEDHAQYDAQVFLSFLENIIAKYPEGKTVMILDNARIHHARLIQPFLTEYSDKLELVLLPPYSPQLNIIEGLWGWMKKSVIYNVFFETVDEIRTAVIGFIDEISKEPMQIVDRLCIKL